MCGSAPLGGLVATDRVGEDWRLSNQRRRVGRLNCPLLLRHRGSPRNEKRFDPLLFVEAVHGIAVNGVRDFVAKSTRQLLGVLHKIEQRVDDIDVAARGCERIGLGFWTTKNLNG